MKIVHIAGARPNFVKLSSIMLACHKQPEIDSYLVHTGQHYSKEMSELFFKELGIPQPDINLGVGSGSHAVQTAEIMKSIETVLIDQEPDYILVVGDVNSTVASALVAVKLGIRIIHVEAGLRSFDRTMPEEINRIITDALSDFLFVTEQSAIENLLKEGIDENKIHMVGNVMIDTLLRNKCKADKSEILERLGILPGNYATVTLHRPSNVDNYITMNGFLDAFEYIEKEIPLIFPMHPRTMKNLIENGLMTRIEKFKNVKIISPLGYLDFLKLMANSKVVITDSGGMQEESTILGVPCMTLRNNTERPVTITHGTNRLVELQSRSIINEFKSVVNGNVLYSKPPLWDGRASERILEILLHG